MDTQCGHFHCQYKQTHEHKASQTEQSLPAGYIFLIRTGINLAQYVTVKFLLIQCNNISPNSKNLFFSFYDHINVVSPFQTSHSDNI